MKYFAYLRKSTEDEDRQAQSISSQKDEALKLIERLGITDYEILSEEKSASKLGRPVFAELMRRVSIGDPCGVICWKLDRLARNPIDGGAILWALQEKRIAEIITPLGTFTPETNVLMMSLEFGMAHQYIKDLSAGIRRGLEKKLSSGTYPARAPLGYRNVGVEKGYKEIDEDPPAAIFVKRVFRLIATGSYSLKSLSRELESEYQALVDTSLKWKAYLERKGNRRKVDAFKKLHFSMLERIVRNPFYYGDFLYRGKLYHGTHQAIISRNLWERANEKLNTPFENKVNPPKHNFPYRGKKLIKCGECGCSITAEIKIKPSGKEYILYRCTKARGKCSQPYLNKLDLEVQIGQIFDGFDLHEDEAEKILQSIEALHREDADYYQQQKANLQAKLKRLENERDVLYRKLAVTQFSEEDSIQYEKIKEDIRAEISKISQQLKAFGADRPYWLVKSSDLIQLAIEAKKLFFEGNNEQRQKLLNLVASDYILKDKKLGFTYKKSVSVLVKRREFLNISG